MSRRICNILKISLCPKLLSIFYLLISSLQAALALTVADFYQSSDSALSGRVFLWFFALAAGFWTLCNKSQVPGAGQALSDDYSSHDISRHHNQRGILNNA